MKANAVFQGGGVKGIGFVGAIYRMEKEGFEWSQLAGTSAGAIVASLLAVGYRGVELKKIISELNYSKLLSRDAVQAVPLVGKMLGLMLEKGYYKTDKIEEWIRSLYKAKGKTKFKDLYENNTSRLKIIAADVTKRKMIIFPDSLAEYGLDPLEFDIARAVSMSLCIPVFFSPRLLEYKNEKSYVVDGGVYSNFPIWIFENKNPIKTPIFGFKFDNENSTLKFKQSSIAYFIDLFESIIETVDEEYIRNEDNIRIITIPTYDIKATKFDITAKESEKLYLSGYNSANSFLSSWDFKKNIENYRARIIV